MQIQQFDSASNRRIRNERSGPGPGRRQRLQSQGREKESEQQERQKRKEQAAKANAKAHALNFDLSNLQPPKTLLGEVIDFHFTKEQQANAAIHINDLKVSTELATDLMTVLVTWGPCA